MSTHIYIYVDRTFLDLGIVFKGIVIVKLLPARNLNIQGLIHVQRAPIAWNGRSNTTHGWVGRLPWPNLTWYSESNTTELHQPVDELGVFLLTSPNPGYSEWNTTELHHPMDELGVCLTWPNPGYGEFNTTELYQPWVGRLLWPNLTLDDDFHTTELHQPWMSWAFAII